MKNIDKLRELAYEKAGYDSDFEPLFNNLKDELDSMMNVKEQDIDYIKLRTERYPDFNNLGKKKKQKATAECKQATAYQRVKDNKDFCSRRYDFEEKYNVNIADGYPDISDAVEEAYSEIVVPNYMVDEKFDEIVKKCAKHLKYFYQKEDFISDTRDEDIEYYRNFRRSRQKWYDYEWSVDWALECDSYEYNPSSYDEAFSVIFDNTHVNYEALFSICVNIESGGYMAELLQDYYEYYHNLLSDNFTCDEVDDYFEILLMADVNSGALLDGITSVLPQYLSESEITSSIYGNPYVKEYLHAKEEIEKQKQREEQAKKEIESIIEQDYDSLFVEATHMPRHFIIHAGDTNSGKTYEALVSLKKSSKGVYLAPLRLLAFEVFEQLNNEGITSSLITGEEEVLKNDSKVICSTCEMANLHDRYEVAVIDECQMIADDSRGGAWTNAIMGIQADEIHLCCSRNATDLLIRILSNMQNVDYTIIHHDRRTPLCWDSNCSLKTVEQGDALIVFSRKRVHSLARTLMNKGYRVSMIYGAMPYMVRQAEAEKFRNGMTDVVVTTDAIGMGLNLPIRRVIFCETQKYDGVSVRSLKPYEVKQIAGRAGRYGIYDTGYYGVLKGKSSYLKGYAECIDAKLDYAVIGFPKVLMQYEEYDIVHLLKAWNNKTERAGFHVQDIEQQIERAEYLVGKCKDRHLTWNLISMSFDNNDTNLLSLWETLVSDVLRSDEILLPLGKRTIQHETEIDQLEQWFKMLDMYYQFYSMLGDTEGKHNVMTLKNAIAYRMMSLLTNKDSLEVRRCSHCGKVLNWDSEHGMCEKCYNEMRAFRSATHYDEEFW